MQNAPQRLAFVRRNSLSNLHYLQAPVADVLHNQGSTTRRLWLRPVRERAPRSVMT